MEKKLRVYPFMRAQKFFGVVSLILIALSLYFVLTKKLNLGVDFRGGISLIVAFDESVKEADIRTQLDELDVGEIQIVRYDQQNENSFLLRLKESDSANQLSQTIINKLKAGFDNNFEILSKESIDSRVGSELLGRGRAAILLSWIFILVYIGFRFDFLFAPGAVLALIHDIIITLGIFAFFELEINLPVLAAGLTIVGYSINDTIVIYDRVRENLLKLPESLGVENLVNRSLSETLARTIVTSLTLIFAVVVLLAFGGEGLFGFALCMLIGVLVGTYSSLFVASPVYLILHRFFPEKSLQKAKVKKKAG